MRVACDGRAMPAGRDMCAPCEKALKRRERRKKEATQ